jgi:hypothetical protein
MPGTKLFDKSLLVGQAAIKDLAVHVPYESQLRRWKFEFEITIAQNLAFQRDADCATAIQNPWNLFRL